MGAASTVELRRREGATDVAVSDVVERPEGDDMRTINHPGNRPLLTLATRVAARAGLPAPADPGRRLLDAVVAPVEPVVAEAWGLGEDATRSTWRIGGRDVTVDEVEEAHREWYAAHPDVTATIWERFAPTARLLGLRP